MKYALKILVIPSWYPPDGGYFFKEHCEALASTGAHVEVLVNRVISIRRLGRIRPDQLGKFRLSTENGIIVLRSWMFKIPGNEKWNARRWIRSTIRLYARYSESSGEPDIILAHSAIWAGCAAYRINRYNGIPFVITEHRSFFLYNTDESRRMLRPFYIPMLRDAYHNSQRLIIVSERMKTGLLELYPGIERKITEIPNMVDGDFFTLPSSKKPVKPFVFVTAGRLQPVKGIDVLIRAVAILRQNGLSGFQLKILGRGEERFRLDNLVNELDLRGIVVFTGRISREQVRDEFHASDCLVLSSRYEAFGVVLIEAMATGLPVIATRSGGPETVVTPSCGYLVNPEDPEELAYAMREMMDYHSAFDPILIRKDVLNRYDRRKIAARYLELLSANLIPETQTG